MVIVWAETVKWSSANEARFISVLCERLLFRCIQDARPQGARTSLVGIQRCGELLAFEYPVTLSRRS